MNRSKLAIAVPVGVAVLVGGVVGVVLGTTWQRGGGGPLDTATAQVRESAGRTAAAGSSRVAVNLNLALGVVDTSLSGEGILDLRKGRGDLALDLPVGSVQGVLDDGNVYVKVPAIPTSRKWVKLDLAQVLPQSDSGLGPLGRLASADPARALALLAQSAGDMHKVGSETVRGAVTTHSRGTFDLGVNGVVVEALGTALLPLDVWVDGEGRMRKMTVKADPDGPGPIPASSLELEMYDFGVTAEVVPPTPNQVITDLTGPVKAVVGLFG